MKPQADTQSWLKANCFARTSPALADFGCQTGNSLLGGNRQRDGRVRGTDQDRLLGPSGYWSVPRTRGIRLVFSARMALTVRK